MQLELTEPEFNLVLECLNMYTQAQTERIARANMMLGMGDMAISMAHNPAITTNPETIALAEQVAAARPEFVAKIENIQAELAFSKELLGRIRPEWWVSEWASDGSAPEIELNDDLNA